LSTALTGVEEEDLVPRKRLSMRKIKEAPRLKAAGLGNREIAASIGAGKTTVYEILARYHVEGLTAVTTRCPIDWCASADVRATATTVEVLRGGKRVASHRREYGRRRYVTDPEHMPASHRGQAESPPSRFISWARSQSR
jgi:Mu transposase, C-terminal domain